MSLSVARGTPSIQQGGHVNSPDLSRLIVGLAHGVQETMASLYDLQTAMTREVAQKNASSSILDQFVEGRTVCKQDWTTFNDFLQNMHTYADNYIQLCGYAATRPAPECLAFAKDVLDIAKMVQAQSHRLATKHRRTYHVLRYHVEQADSGSTEPQYASSTSAASFQPDPASTLALIEFIRAAEASDAKRTLSAVNKGLMEIQTALQDMVVFWKDEVHRLIDITSQPEETFCASLDQPGVPAEKWRDYQKVIMTANSSIMESSDAVLINDLRTPSNSMNVSQLRSGHLQGVPNRMDHDVRSRHGDGQHTGEGPDEKHGLVDHAGYHDSHSTCCLIM